MLVRRLARPLLASTFVFGGIDTLRNPEGRAGAAKRVTSAIPADDVQLVMVNSAAQIVAGSLLALGRLPRLSAAVLAVSLVPTTLAGHPFWEQTDAAARKAQLQHFLKNASMLGGLLLAAVDTEGRPSVAWRTRRAAKEARRAGKVAAKAGRAEAKGAAKGLHIARSAV